MKHFLLVFDRSAGRLLVINEYAGRAKALRARFETEKQYRGNPAIEVVVLTARSPGDLRHTHARYFADEQEIARHGLSVHAEGKRAV